MKKLQVLAGIASIVAIASSIAVADAASALPCSYKKSGAAGSGENKIATLGFLGLAGVLGGGATYMSYRAGQRASAACAAMSDNFEVFEESIDLIADIGVAEAADAVAALREHPEAPGGELDLPILPVAELSAESAIEQDQSAIVK